MADAYASNSIGARVQMPIQRNCATTDVQMLLQHVMGKHQSPPSAGLGLGVLLWGVQTQSLLP